MPPATHSPSLPLRLVTAVVLVGALASGCSDDGSAASAGAADGAALATASAAHSSTATGDSGGADAAPGANGPGGAETRDSAETCEGLDESTRPCCADTCGDDWCQDALCSHGTWVCEWPKQHIGDAFTGGECSSVCSSTPARGMMCSVDGWVCDPELSGALDTCPAQRTTVCYSCSSWSPPADNPCDCACESGVVKCGGA